MKLKHKSSIICVGQAFLISQLAIPCLGTHQANGKEANGGKNVPSYFNRTCSHRKKIKESHPTLLTFVTSKKAMNGLILSYILPTRQNISHGGNLLI